MRIDLGQGASVVLTFKGNLFDLDSRERTLLADLAKVVKVYQDGQLVPPSQG